MTTDLVERAVKMWYDSFIIMERRRGKGGFTNKVLLMIIVICMGEVIKQ